MRIFLLIWGLLLCWPAFGGVKVISPGHDIARGATISESDLTYTTAASDVMSGTVTTMDELVGMQARRTLRAGETLRLGDVRRPVVVAKGSTVTMTFEVPGLVLTASGRAMSEGGIGDTVTVQNPASYRQISAIVIGPGQVRAQTGGARLAGVHH